MDGMVTASPDTGLIIAGDGNKRDGDGVDVALLPPNGYGNLSAL